MFIINGMKVSVTRRSEEQERTVGCCSNSRAPPYMASTAELGLCRSLSELIPVTRLRLDADISCLLGEQTDIFFLFLQPFIFKYLILLLLLLGYMLFALFYWLLTMSRVTFVD